MEFSSAPARSHLTTVSSWLTSTLQEQRSGRLLQRFVTWPLYRKSCHNEDLMLLDMFVNSFYFSQVSFLFAETSLVPDITSIVSPRILLWSLQRGTMYHLLSLVSSFWT